jgi:hypothetical protein
MEDLLLCSSYLLLGFPTGGSSTSTPHHQQVLWRRCREGRRLLQGESLTHNLLLCFCFALFYFCLHRFIKNTKKISSFIVAFIYLLLVLLEWVLLNDFICTPIAPPAPEVNFYEIKPTLLNLVIKEQFFDASSDNAAAHLNNFVELCEMQKYKDVDGNIIKLKLFPFSLRGRAKDWLLSLPRNSIDSWDKYKDAFIRKYYPPTMIIALRSDIIKFRQFNNEHIAT